MRVSNLDKERAIDVLKSGFAEGRLTKDEYDERVGEAYASRTYDDLAQLTADLPIGPLGAINTQAHPLQQPVHPPYPARGHTNGLAVASLLCALLPGLPWFISIGLGLAARGQIKARGERGISLANAGIAISGFFILLAVILALGHY